MWKFVRYFLSGGALLAVLLWTSVTAAVAGPGFLRISQTAAGVGGNNQSQNAVISNDGRSVVFGSGATNLGSQMLGSKVYLFDRDPNLDGVFLEGEGRLLLVADGLGIASCQAISGDGRHVFYTGGLTQHLWTHDRDPDGNGVFDEQASAPVPLLPNGAIAQRGASEDGRFVAFSSRMGLVPQDTNGLLDIYVLDRDLDGNGIFDEGNELIHLVSKSSGGGPGNEHSHEPVISGDGRHVSFSSESSNLVPGDTNGAGDVFAHDLLTGITIRVSVTSSGQQATEHGCCPRSSISENGRFVVFSSASADLGEVDLNGRNDVYLRDRDPDSNGIFDEGNGVTSLVSSRPDGVAGNRGGEMPDISSDGRFVMMNSSSTDLVPGQDPSNSSSYVFVVDRDVDENGIFDEGNRVIRRSSDTPEGMVAGHSTVALTISDDGKHFAFESADTNLTPNDVNGFQDVFVGSCGLRQKKIGQGVGGFSGPLDLDARFSSALCTLTDLDGDGFEDLISGASGHDGGKGAVWVLFMNADGTVREEQEISEGSGGFLGVLGAFDAFGSSAVELGDLDGDGFSEVAIGAPGDSDGGSHRGAVWVLSLLPNGLVHREIKISDLVGGLAGSLDDGDEFGSAVASLGDLDLDGVPDLAVGAPFDDDGGADRGAVWIIFLKSDGSVVDERKVSSTTGGFSGVLDEGDIFSTALAGGNDMNLDGIPDLVVGAPGDDDGGLDQGAVWILRLLRDGSVGSSTKISASSGSLMGPLSPGAEFGQSIGLIRDLDCDQVPELVVGSPGDDVGGDNQGAAWVLHVRPNGSVQAEEKVGPHRGCFSGPLENGDRFGESVTALRDLDGDGEPDLVIGAPFDVAAGGPRGAGWVLFGDESRFNAPSLPCLRVSDLVITVTSRPAYRYRRVNGLWVRIFSGHYLYAQAHATVVDDAGRLVPGARVRFVLCPMVPGQRRRCRAPYRTTGAQGTTHPHPFGGYVYRRLNGPPVRFRAYVISVTKPGYRFDRAGSEIHEDVAF